jgi:hypothetical protein
MNIKNLFVIFTLWMMLAAQIAVCEEGGSKADSSATDSTVTASPASDTLSPAGQSAPVQAAQKKSKPEPVSSSGGGFDMNILLYAGLGVIVVGGIAALVLMGGKKKMDTTPPSDTSAVAEVPPIVVPLPK